MLEVEGVGAGFYLGGAVLAIGRYDLELSANGATKGNDARPGFGWMVNVGVGLADGLPAVMMMVSITPGTTEGLKRVLRTVLVRTGSLKSK